MTRSWEPEAVSDATDTASGGRADGGPLRVRDACGILGGITRERSPLGRFVKMLAAMAHRGGDGLGIHFRIAPEQLESEIEDATHRGPTASALAAGGDPLILTLQVPESVAADRAVGCTRGVLERHGLELVYARPVSRFTRDAERVRTWRFVASDAAAVGSARLAERTLGARRELEALAGSNGLPPSFYPASFSTAGMVLYKIVGTLDDWLDCFGRDALESVHTDCFIGHVRYSTNTLPRHRSAQPFGFLAHNGEINNIGAVRRVMHDLAIPTSRALSDSSELNALVEQLCMGGELELTEALRLLFPNRWMSPDSECVDAGWHAWLGHVARPVRAEGPAAIVASDGRWLVGSLDSLGLRPLSFVQTRTGDVFFASEPGAVAPLAEIERIHRLKPGEMIAAFREDAGVRVVGEAALSAGMRERHGGEAARRAAGPRRAELPTPEATAPPDSDTHEARTLELRRGVAGFSRRVRRQLESLFFDGSELGSGTGWRGGLAVARGPGARLADAFQAMTAQVTAPTLSAEHEMPAMEGRVVLGAAASLDLVASENDGPCVDLALPFVLPDEDLPEEDAAPIREAAERLGIASLRGLRSEIGSGLAEIDARADGAGALDDAAGGERIRATLDRICKESADHARAGNRPLVLLRCTWGTDLERAPLPPELVVGAVDHELTQQGLRRSVSLLVASDEISDPHSMFVLLQLGADALVPTLLCRDVLALARRRRRPTVDTLERGLRGIARALFISYGRIATSELAAGRGGRRVCAVGLDTEIVETLGLPSSLGGGLRLGDSWQGLQLRSRAMAGDAAAQRALQEDQVDTMPLDVSLGSYGLLGGFKPAPGRRARSVGQLRLAARVIASAIARQGPHQHDPTDALPPFPAADDAEEGARLLEWVDGLPIERLADLHRELYAPLRGDARSFLDSLCLAHPGEGTARDWKSVRSGIDGRRTNQILGAISYGANNRLVHELYALVMARCGAMSNGGEGGVPDHVRALFVTARLAARGGSARALVRQLSLEAPAYLDALDPEQRESHCRRLLQTIPEDFAASRFEQISTARFGVDAYALHDARLLEIKIGQGAKPGVGGSLPGEKVLPAIAATRGVNVGQTLNSPTVHHDIYSIEDLRQLVTALKTLHPESRVCVKLAAMDDLDVIALGVVKAGADFIWIDGYEGGTGSAKDAHKEHCGLPAAPVVRQVHETLVAQGMRGSYRARGEPRFLSRRDFHGLERREQAGYRWQGPRIVASGGVRSAEDGLKLILAGADYVGFGDAAQNAVGCIRCEKCHTGSCPSYVATNDPRRSESFDLASADSALTRFVELLDVGMRKLASQVLPGVRHLEELVGRTDLLRPAEGAALRLDAGFFVPVSETDPGAAARIDSRCDVTAARRAAALQLESAFAGWRRAIHASLAEQGLYVEDPNALADVAPRRLRLPDALRRLEVEVQVDNRDRLLGTGIVHGFVELRRLVELATGDRLELALRARGAAGNGFGMFAVDGMDLSLMGSGGDYLGEAVNGPRIFVLPAVTQKGDLLTGSGDAGSASVYGMRGGEVHLFDQPGARFGIRLSGGTVFVWGDSASVEASFARDAVKPQFTGEYMTRGVLVLCRDPGRNLLCAATGRDTEMLCRKPEMCTREQWARELSQRIPDAFEVADLEDRHAALIERGARTYQERARSMGIEHPVTPLRPDEDPRDTFLLLRERRGPS